MPGRVMVVSFAILLFAAAAFPQCNLTPVASAQFRSSIFDLAVDGNDLWAATGYGVTLYDRSVDPPVIVGSLAVPGTTRVVRTANGLAYAGSGTFLVAIRKSSRALVIAGIVDTGATVNDLVVRTNDLFVATSNGIAQFDLLNPNVPVRTPAVFVTSGSNVTSLSLAGSTTLYAADGDASVEVFDVSISTLPQRVGSFNSLPRSTSVHANGGRVYVSDGQSTDVFVGAGISLTPAAAAPLAFGSISLSQFSTGAIFAAGSDRRLRAFDVTTAGSPIEVFRSDLSPAGGTVNRITSMVVAGGRLYVGAGDIGLLTYDIGAFAQPFPLRAYSGPATTSVLTLANKVYFSRSSGGISEFTQSANGSLTQARSWDGGRVDVIQDGSAETGLLLTSSGSSATLWTLTSTIPTAIATTTFRAAVTSAALIGTTGYALLADRSLWSADFSQTQPVPQAIAINAKPTFLARSGSSLVLADLRDDGTTALFFFATPDFSATPAPISVPGLATSGVTLSGKTAAVWTFRGLTLADFGAGSSTLLPQSNAFGAKALSLNGTTLVEVTDSALIAWDTAGRRIANQFTLPSAPVGVNISPSGTVANLATTDGVTSVQLAGSTKMPSLLGTANPNAYYKEVTAAAGHVDLVDSRGVDIFTSSLHFVGSVRTPGFIDAVAADRGLYTISSNLLVSAYSPDGAFQSSITISEGSDALPLSITTSNGAVWVSIRRGCPANCENKTLVFDARSGSLTQTDSFSGDVRDVVTRGTSAYVLTEITKEIRLFDVSDPYHPKQLVSRSSVGEGVHAPVSIAAAGGTVYVIGDRLYAYAEKDLAKGLEQLVTYPNDSSTGVTYIDQHLRIDGGCATLTGRGFSPQLFTVGSPAAWTAAPSFPVPSPARSLASVAGTIYVLTDHSLEVWSAQPLTAPGRRRATR